MLKKRQHVANCKRERVEMEKLLQRARDDPDEWTCLATDWSNPHFMPHRARTPKSWLTKKRLKYQVFGIRDYGANTRIIQPHFDFWSHDSNMHMSFLFSYLRSLKEQGKLGKRLMLQMDNCWKDNKNKYFLAFLGELVATKWFTSIEVYYLRPGHSHAMVDRDCFKPLGRHTRAMYSYWTPEEFWNNFVRPAFRRQLATVKQLEVVIVFDWKAWMEERLRDIQFHSFQRAFIVEFEDSLPVLRFKKNILRREWRGLKRAPENGLQLLSEAHEDDSRPLVIPPTPLDAEDLADLTSLSGMPPSVQTFWGEWIETPFGPFEFVLPQSWIDDFWLSSLNVSSESESETTSDENPFSTEERDVHVVHHPNVIPLLDLAKGVIIAVVPTPEYYENNPDVEREPFWLGQIIRQRTPKRNGSETVHAFKVAWFYSVPSRDANATPVYHLDETDIGEVYYKNILMHNIQLTRHKKLPVADRRKLLRMTES